MKKDNNAMIFFEIEIIEHDIMVCEMIGKGKYKSILEEIEKYKNKIEEFKKQLKYLTTNFSTFSGEKSALAASVSRYNYNF